MNVAEFLKVVEVLKIIFAGTPAFAATALDALIAAGHRIVLVLTQPDRPAGRGLSLQPSPVKQLALARQIPLAQPATLKDEAIVTTLAALDADVMVVAAYGLLIPRALLDLPPRGCVNIHASLLPRWRGAAPIQRAILAGDRETGVTIMQMDAGLDTGAMLLAQRVPIAADDTAQTLHDKLAITGAQLIVRALDEAPEPVAQDVTRATYAAKISKSEAHIDWARSAVDIDRQIRAFNPAPGAHTELQGQRVKVWRAAPVAGHGVPGTVLSAGADGVVVATGAGALCLLELQRAGGKRLPAQAFLAGTPVAPGVSFDG